MCKNVLTLQRYRDFRVGTFYSDLPCKPPGRLAAAISEQLLPGLRVNRMQSNYSMYYIMHNTKLLLIIIIAVVVVVAVSARSSLHPTDAIRES